MVQVLEQHISLAHYVILFIALENHLLVEYFNCVDGVLLLVLRREDFPKGSFPDSAEKLKITWLHVLLLRLTEIEHLLADI